jgi:hypothetical protein
LAGAGSTHLTDPPYFALPDLERSTEITLSAGPTLDSPFLWAIILFRRILKGDSIMERARSYHLGWTLLLAFIMFAASINGFAFEGSFRQVFIKNYKEYRFKEQMNIDLKNRYNW